MINIRSKSGSYIVDAALILPIMILAVVAIISIVPIISKTEAIIGGCADEARLECILAHFRKNPAMLAMRSKERCSKEARNVNHLMTFSTGYMYKSGSMDNMINLHYRGEVDPKATLGMFKSVVLEGRMQGRAFVGISRDGNPMDRSEFEKDEKAHIVYVFPEYGEHFHEHGCRILSRNSSGQILTRSIRAKYKPCKICHPEKLPQGSTVYCTESSKKYHKSDCKARKSTYIDMEKSKAIERGYKPCKICGT